jgi:GR25 family glycosyltransferase involved in LPS biosynthesis
MIPIYIINSAKDIDKKPHMKNLCSKHGMNAYFINAVYGKNISSQQLLIINDASADRLCPVFS